jgi:hypothetical protein
MPTPPAAPCHQQRPQACLHAASGTMDDHDFAMLPAFSIIQTLPWYGQANGFSARTPAPVLHIVCDLREVAELLQGVRHAIQQDLVPTATLWRRVAIWNVGMCLPSLIGQLLDTPSHLWSEPTGLVGATEQKASRSSLLFCTLQGGACRLACVCERVRPGSGHWAGEGI